MDSFLGRSSCCRPPKGVQRLDGLVQSKIIKDKHVMFFDEFTGDGYEKSDIEDLFKKSEYLEIFGEAFRI